MNPSISLIVYSEEDARYRSHWVKSPFMKGITALRSATLKALRLSSIFSASCLNCSLSKMPPNAGFSTNQKKQERQRLGSCSTEPALPVEALLLEDLPQSPVSRAPHGTVRISVANPSTDPPHGPVASGPAWPREGGRAWLSSLRSFLLGWILGMRHGPPRGAESESAQA